MKPMTLSELATVADHLRTLAQARVQEFRSGETWCEFGFYISGEMQYVLMDLNPQSPVLLPLAAPAKLGRSKRTPLELFIRAHVLSHHLKSVQLLQDRGRVVEMEFTNGSRVEFRVFPRAQNVIVSTGDKKISFHKAPDLPPAVVVQEPNGRTLEQLCEQYLQKFIGDSKGPGTPRPDGREKALQKKIAAREKMREDLEIKKQSSLREIGEWLKEHQTLNVPQEWREHLDMRESFSVNLQNVFKQAKDLQNKIARAEERLKMIDDEIESLRQAKDSGAEAVPQKKADSILQKAGAKARTVQLSSGHQLFIGRSGADNLRILRTASAWDYWLHLKDEPGSHATLRRQKNEKIADVVFLEALQHLVRATYGDKAQRHAGEKFSGLVVECRYVKPIKGDRLGRVTYRNERVLPFTYTS